MQLPMHILFTCQCVTVRFLHLHTTLSIGKVGDCGLQTYQIVTLFEHDTALDLTTITPILYIHCYKLAILTH